MLSLTYRGVWQVADLLSRQLSARKLIKRFSSRGPNGFGMTNLPSEILPATWHSNSKTFHDIVLLRPYLEKARKGWLPRPSSLSKTEPVKRSFEHPPCFKALITTCRFRVLAELAEIGSNSGER